MVLDPGQARGVPPAFAGFAPDVVARFDEDDVDRLMTDASIVRNRLKIESTVSNARVIDAMHRAGDTFGELVWSFVSGATVHNGWAELGELPVVDRDLEGHERRTASAGLSLRGPRDLLLHHAGGGTRERPRDVVPPVEGPGWGGRVDDVTGSAAKPTERSDGSDPRTPSGTAAARSGEHGSEEEIDEAGDESFPASDAPQWWSGEPDDDDK